MSGLRHPEDPHPTGMQLDRVRRFLLRAEVGQLLRQEPQAAAKPPLHRHRRDAEQLGGLQWSLLRRGTVWQEGLALAN